jgi:hypothetical protein
MTSADLNLGCDDSKSSSGDELGPHRRHRYHHGCSVGACLGILIARFIRKVARDLVGAVP